MRGYYDERNNDNIQYIASSLTAGGLHNPGIFIKATKRLVICAYSNRGRDPQQNNDSDASDAGHHCFYKRTFS